MDTPRIRAGIRYALLRTERNGLTEKVVNRYAAITDMTRVRIEG